MQYVSISYILYFNKIYSIYINNSDIKTAVIFGLIIIQYNNKINNNNNLTVTVLNTK